MGAAISNVRRVWFVSRGQTELYRDSCIEVLQQHGLFPGDHLGTHEPSPNPQGPGGSTERSRHSTPSSTATAIAQGLLTWLCGGGKPLHSNRGCSPSCPADPMSPAGCQCHPRTVTATSPALPTCPAQWHDHYHSLPPPPLLAVQLLLATDL